jgi:hypothetical protein
MAKNGVIHPIEYNNNKSYLINIFVYAGPHSSVVVDLADEDHDYGAIDSIAYKGGPITMAEHTEYRRENFPDGHKLALRKKTVGNDDSESDNSNDSVKQARTRQKISVRPKTRVCDGSIKQTLQEGACNELGKADDSDCVHISVKKRARIHSQTSDAVSWRGVRIHSIRKVLEETYGESRNGRIRIKLYAPQHLLRMKALLIDLLKCSLEVELLALLKSSCGEQIKFQLFYKSEGYLYSCINGDGLCGPRNFAALQQGIFLNQFPLETSL